MGLAANRFETHLASRVREPGLEAAHARPALAWYIPLVLHPPPRHGAADLKVEACAVDKIELQGMDICICRLADLEASYIILIRTHCKER